MLKTTKFKNGTITFSDTGKGRVVVLLHGFLGSHQIWESTIQSLSKSFRVIAIDLPGHGGTDCFGYVHTTELTAKCVKAVTDSLRFKKYVIIGHSMGGYAALAFAGQQAVSQLQGELCKLCSIDHDLFCFSVGVIVVFFYFTFLFLL